MSDLPHQIALCGLGLLSAWFVSETLHQQIETYASEREAKQQEPLTPNEQLAQRLVAMRKQKARATDPTDAPGN